MNLRPFMMLSMQKTVVANEISELKTVYDAKYAKDSGCQCDK